MLTNKRDIEIWVLAF